MPEMGLSSWLRCEKGEYIVLPRPDVFVKQVVCHARTTGGRRYTLWPIPCDFYGKESLLPMFAELIDPIGELGEGDGELGDSPIELFPRMRLQNIIDARQEEPFFARNRCMD